MTTPDRPHRIDAQVIDGEWYHLCIDCGAESWGNAPPLPCEPTEDHQ